MFIDEVAKLSRKVLLQTFAQSETFRSYHAFFDVPISIGAKTSPVLAEFVSLFL
jgi:hypothetical protein